MYTEEGCQHCRWAIDETGWNYCPECGLPADPLKAFKNVSPPSEASEQKVKTPKEILAKYFLSSWMDTYSEIASTVMEEYASQFTRPSVVTQSAEQAQEIMGILAKCYNKRKIINEFQPMELDIIYEAMQEYSLLERSRALEELRKYANEHYEQHTGIMVIRKVDLESLLEKLKSRQ